MNYNVLKIFNNEISKKEHLEKLAFLKCDELRVKVHEVKVYYLQ